MTDRLSYYAMTGQKPSPSRRAKTLLARLAAAALGGAFWHDGSAFRGKRIVVVGPADTAARHFSPARIDAYDLVVRVNSSLDLVENARGALGTRTDVLYHNLKEHGERSTGPIRSEALAAQGTHLIVCPTPTDEKLAVILKAKARYARLGRRIPALRRLQVRATPRHEYAALCELLDGYWPTTGLACIYSVLQSDFAELAITGFSFYTTGYAPGYQQQLSSPAEVEAWTAQNVVHKTSLEKDVFCRVVDEARRSGKNVVLDPLLASFLTDRLEQRT